MVTPANAPGAADGGSRGSLHEQASLFAQSPSSMPFHRAGFPHYGRRERGKLRRLLPGAPPLECDPAGAGRDIGNTLIPLVKHTGREPVGRGKILLHLWQIGLYSQPHPVRSYPALSARSDGGHTGGSGCGWRLSRAAAGQWFPQTIRNLCSISRGFAMIPYGTQAYSW